MRTARNLFPRLCDPGHLDWAAELTVRGKRRRRDVAWFLFRREAELARIGAALASERYRPEGFELVTIRDPKPRLIARVPIADRVVHTALVKLMEPVFLPGLLPEAYACRAGYGTHRAVLRLQELMRRHRFVVHLDVRSYFPSIDRAILRRLLGRRIHDERFLAVVDRVLAAGAGIYDSPDARRRAHLADDWPPPGRGLPIGAYTSQLFAAHVYLAGLDHFIKRDLKVPGLCRYVDDIFCFGDRRADLRRWRRELADWLREERHLRLKHPEARILSCYGHLDALGYRLRRDDRQPLPRALRRLRRRAAGELARRPGEPGKVDFGRSVAATAGVVLF